MPFTQPFATLRATDASTAGGKGASLGEMTQAGVPVPPGFVVLTSAFEYFLDEVGLKPSISNLLKQVALEDPASVETASTEIRKLILGALVPDVIETEILATYNILGAEYVAVRSSATAEDGSEASWAGELESFLDTTQETLIEHVQLCWASLFTPRAITYRFEKNLQDKSILVAVVVQKMVASEVAGVAFSVHPVTENPDHIIIEAGWGLGEALVSGVITPDQFVVDKKTSQLLDIYEGDQDRLLVGKSGGGIEWQALLPSQHGPKLSQAQVTELAQLVTHIEQHYGFPCDIEWALEAGHFYITQSRPITTLTKP